MKALLLMIFAQFLPLSLWASADQVEAAPKCAVPAALGGQWEVFESFTVPEYEDQPNARDDFDLLCKRNNNGDRIVVHFKRGNLDGFVAFRKLEFMHVVKKGILTSTTLKFGSQEIKDLKQYIDDAKSGNYDYLIAEGELKDVNGVKKDVVAVLVPWNLLTVAESVSEPRLAVIIANKDELKNASASTSADDKVNKDEPVRLRQGGVIHGKN
jgi:hypothetical protein